MNIEVLWDGTYGLSSLSEKTRKSNRLQVSLQRQHFLLSNLKTLSVGPAGVRMVRTHDLPHGSPVLNQLSQPVGGSHVHIRVHVPQQNSAHQKSKAVRNMSVLNTCTDKDGS